MQRPVGMSGSALGGRAASVAAPRLAAPLAAKPALGRRADRRAMRVAAAASPETAPVKLTGDDLKEANRVEMRTGASRGRQAGVGGCAVRASHWPAWRQAQAGACMHARARLGQRAACRSVGAGRPAACASPPNAAPDHQRWLTPSSPFPSRLPLPPSVFDFALW